MTVTCVPMLGTYYLVKICNVISSYVQLHKTATFTLSHVTLHGMKTSKPVTCVAHPPRAGSARQAALPFHAQPCPVPRTVPGVGGRTLTRCWINESAGLPWPTGSHRTPDTTSHSLSWALRGVMTSAPGSPQQGGTTAARLGGASASAHPPVPVPAPCFQPRSICPCVLHSR